MTIEFKILGPMEVRHDGRLLEVGHPKQRCVLAILLTEPNLLIPTGKLVNRIWGDDPPSSARNILYGHIGRLKTTLATGGTAVSLSRKSGGYQLSLEPATVDLHRFRELVSAARQPQDDQRSAILLDEAHALWRGAAFADVASPWLADLRITLDHEWLTSLLDRNELFLKLNRSTEILSELDDLARHHPLDERIAQQLVVALYRSGKKAEALTALSTIRTRLAEEIGLDPGQSLQDLEKKILVEDTSLLESF